MLKLLVAILVSIICFISVAYSNDFIQAIDKARKQNMGDNYTPLESSTPTPVVDPVAAQNFLNILKKATTVKYIIDPGGQNIEMGFNLTTGQVAITADGLVSILPFKRE